MGKDIKFLIGAFLITVLIIAGAAVIFSRASTKTSDIPTSEVLGLSVSPEGYDMGEVAIDGGIVARQYEIENTTDKPLSLIKLATSCMCTRARIKVGEKETSFFGMEMPGDNNPPLKLKIAPGQKASVEVNFDPAAHGPQGVGPFDRIVWLYFSEGVKELKFNGVVTAQ